MKQFKKKKLIQYEKFFNFSKKKEDNQTSKKYSKI